jgi:uncharacterized protein with HEPN domain
MVDRNLQRLLQIREAISSIRTFCDGKTVSEFKDNDLLYSAVLQKFMIIGESVARLDQALTDKYKYHWYKPRSFRNFIAQEYHRILPERIWDTIQNDLDGLEWMINLIIKEEYPDSQFD